MPIEEPQIDEPTGPKKESLEERQARLRERADALKKKQQEEKDVPPKVEAQKESADVFRRTGMRWGESAGYAKAKKKLSNSSALKIRSHLKQYQNHLILYDSISDRKCCQQSVKPLALPISFLHISFIASMYL